MNKKKIILNAIIAFLTSFGAATAAGSIEGLKIGLLNAIIVGFLAGIIEYKRLCEDEGEKGGLFSTMGSSEVLLL
jgi:hypothetical protein